MHSPCFGFLKNIDTKDMILMMGFAFSWWKWIGLLLVCLKWEMGAHVWLWLGVGERTAQQFIALCVTLSSSIFILPLFPILSSLPSTSSAKEKPNLPEAKSLRRLRFQKTKFWPLVEFNVSERFKKKKRRRIHRRGRWTLKKLKRRQ